MFDLDDTLLVEVAAADAAFLETAALAADRYGVDAQALAKAVREQARPLWHASPAREYCLRVGVSSWEGLWARYLGDDPRLRGCLRKGSSARARAKSPRARRLKQAMPRSSSSMEADKVMGVCSRVKPDPLLRDPLEILRDWAPTYRLAAWSAALEQFNIHDPALALALAEEFPVRRRQHHRLYPDALPVLEALHGRFRLGLVTNGLACLQREKIQGVQIAPYFEAIAISGDLGIGKPQPAIFHAVLDPLGVRPDQALMVGNSVKADIGGARAVGMKAILVDRGDPHGKDDTIRPDAMVHDLAGVMEYLGLSGRRTR